MNDNIDTHGFLNKFNSLVEAKRKQALFLKLFFASFTVIFISILFFAYAFADRATDRILVVSTGGEFLPVKTTELDVLYKTLLSAHCYSVSYYANSFNVNNIKNNQARAAFLVNQTDLNYVYEKYQYDQAYSDAVNKGVMYNCEFTKITSLHQKGNGSEYDVEFLSILNVFLPNAEPEKFEIRSKGVAVRVTPRFPENPTGFYFKSYEQEYFPINLQD